MDGRGILDDIDWSVPTGARAGIVGANGSGKTSLIRVLSGYRHPTEGSAEVLGETIGKTCLAGLRRRIGLVEPTLAHIIVERSSTLDVVESGFFGGWTVDFDQPSAEQTERARAVLRDVGLGGMEDRIFCTLSMGEQRRALVARALVSRPELLILDESTSGLDVLARETLLASVDRLSRRDRDMTVLVVTHHLDELLPGTSEVLLLAGGKKVASGPPEEVLTRASFFEAFGVPIDVRRQGDRWTWHVNPEVWPSLLNDGSLDARALPTTGRDRQTHQ